MGGTRFRDWSNKELEEAIWQLAEWIEETSDEKEKKHLIKRQSLFLDYLIKRPGAGRQDQDNER